MKRTIAASVLALTVFLPSARATLQWTPPITVDDPNIVGAAGFLTGDGGGSAATIAPVAQQLLTLGPGITQTIDGRQYQTSTTDYNGIIHSGWYTKDDSGGLAVPMGWEYVIAKYDGDKAGYVLFYLGYEDAVLPQFSHSIWWNGTSTNSYALSGWTAFNGVPEPTTMIAGALMLLPLGASAVRILRKDRKA